MNSQRRKAIKGLSERLAAAQEELEEIREEVEFLKDEEEEYRENMPGNLHTSERYERADAAVEALGAALDSLDESTSGMTEAIEQLETAQE